MFDIAAKRLSEFRDGGDKMLGTGYSPPREEGWLRHQENFGEAYLSAADGLVAHKLRVVASDHPGRSKKGGFAAFSCMLRPPLLARRGIPLPQTCGFGSPE